MTHTKIVFLNFVYNEKCGQYHLKSCIDLKQSTLHYASSDTQINKLNYDLKVYFVIKFLFLLFATAKFISFKQVENHQKMAIFPTVSENQASVKKASIALSVSAGRACVWLFRGHQVPGLLQ